MIKKENKSFRKMFIVTEYAALIGMKPADSDLLNLEEKYNCQWLKQVKFL